MQRGPYAGRQSGRSYEERLALRQEPQPTCRCGCGTLTRWLSRKGRWAVYAKGHYRGSARLFSNPPPTPRGPGGTGGSRPSALLPQYDNPEWLRMQYVEKQRTIAEIATECGVAFSSVRKAMTRHGVPARNMSDSHIGRMVGAKNPAWKGGVADWDYAAGWKVIARKIRDRDEWTCQSCAERRKRWGHSLHVHHIDGDKLNNDPTNLVSLCARCHRNAHKGVI